MESFLTPLEARPTAGSSITALQRVANRPIVCHVLDRLRSAGVEQAAMLLTAETSGAIQACVAEEGPAELEVLYLPYGEPESAEQARERALGLVAEDACIVHAVDGLAAQPLVPFADLLRSEPPDLVVLLHQGEGGSEPVGLATRRLLRLAEAAPARKALELASVCCYGPGSLARVSEQGGGWWPGSDQGFVAMAEQLAAEDGRVHVALLDGWRRYTGNVSDLLVLNGFALDALGPQRLGRIADGESRIEGNVAIHPSASIQSSVIVGPTIIGPEARVVESYLGPYTAIGAGVHIEGSEIERSIILPGAGIRHVGGRLVASVVGRDAQIFRDFSLPRAMRLNVSDGDEVALC